MHASLPNLQSTIAHMQGGFKGWVAAGLPVTEPGDAEYTASAVDLIGDNLEVVAQRVRPGRGRGSTEFPMPSVSERTTL